MKLLYSLLYRLLRHGTKSSSYSLGTSFDGPALLRTPLFSFKYVLVLNCELPIPIYLQLDTECSSCKGNTVYTDGFIFAKTRKANFIHQEVW